MQGDAVTVAAVDMGTRRGPPRRLDGNGGPYAEAQGHCGCSTRGSVSVHECEVRLSLVRLWVGVHLCPLKVSVDTSLVDGVHNRFVRQVPRVPSKSPHTGDTTGGRALRMPA